MKIYIEKELGDRIFTRERIRSLNIPEEENVIIDFSGIQFITRSVADELCNLLANREQITYTEMTGIVKEMYDIVRNSRIRTRVLSGNKTNIRYCKTMDEVRKALVH